jgi:hypothetical protein
MTRTFAKKMVLLLLLFATVFLVANVAAACPTCKDGIAANDPEHAGIVKGYFYSILFMMGMPYALITCFGLYMWRQVKSARAKEAANAAAEAASASSPTAVAADAPVRAPELIEA